MCGAHALCTAALHRPVCACEDGYEGNPYDKCTKVTRTSLVSGSRYITIVALLQMPSRVGMRFRRK